MNTLKQDMVSLRECIAQMSRTLDMMERRIQEESGIATGYTRPHVQAIFSVVCEHYAIPETVMHLRCRRAAIALARQVAMFLARELTKYAADDIAKCFRLDMDSGTIFHGCKRVVDQMAYDKDLRAVIEKLTVESRKRIEATATFIPATR